MINKFFVYGTLKVHGYFAHIFDDLRETSVEAKLKNFDLYKVGNAFDAWFPGIVPGNGVVLGEVHGYNPKYIGQVYSAMDRIEGYLPSNPEKSLYKRQLLEVELLDSTTEVANVYVYNRKIEQNFELITNGVWDV